MPDYEFPDVQTLVRYLAMLREVIVHARLQSEPLFFRFIPSLRPSLLRERLGWFVVAESTNIALTQYNLSLTHDIGKAMGGFAFAILVLALGPYLFQRGGKPQDP